MPQAVLASPSRDAASLATTTTNPTASAGAAAAAAAAMPCSPPPTYESEYLSQVSPLPSRAKSMVWPPSTEIQRHSISLLDNNFGGSGADTDPAEAGGGGGSSACARSEGRSLPHGAASQPGQEDAVAVEEGGGVATAAVQSHDLRNGESIPMDVEEEDQLPSRAGEIVGGGRRGLSSSSPPSATASPGRAPATAGSASGSPASGCAASNPVDGLGAEASNGRPHVGPQSVPSPVPVGHGTKDAPTIAADSRGDGTSNRPSRSPVSSPISPTNSPCAAAAGEPSGAAAAAAAAAVAAGGSRPSPGSADEGDGPGREDPHPRRRRRRGHPRRCPDTTVAAGAAGAGGGLDTTIAGRTTVRRRSTGVAGVAGVAGGGVGRQATSTTIDVDALESNGPAGEDAPTDEEEEGEGEGEEVREAEGVASNANAAGIVVAETDVRTRAGSTRSRRSLSRSTSGSGGRAAQLPLPLPHEHSPHSPPDSSGGGGKRSNTATPGGGAVEQEEPGGGGGAAGAGSVGPSLSSLSPPDGDLEGGEGAAGVEEVVDDSPIPCMLLLDSTKGHRSQEVFRMVRKYVEAAWNNTRGKSSGKSSGSTSKVDVTAKLLGGCSPPIPQQTNDCDCGVYVIHYAKLILEKPPLTTQRFLERKGKGGVFSKKWFDSSVISGTRKTIRDTVETMRWDCLEKERAATDAAAAANAAGVAGAIATSTRAN
ncbi:unnamed protein product [Ectocarpus fasciculatus]